MELKYKIISLFKIFHEKSLKLFSQETHFNYFFSRILKKYNFIDNRLERIILLNKLKIKIRKRDSDSKVFVQIFENHEYKILLELLNSFQNKNEYIILDCGANVGYTSLYLSQSSQKVKIICVEPFKETAYYLNENLKINNLNYQVINKVLWINSTDSLVLKDFRDNLAWSKSFELADENDIETYESIDIPTIMLNDSINIIDILKIDIEGAEAKLFNNIKFLNILEKNVKILAIEVHEDFIKYIEVENILKNLNFLFFHSGELIIAINNNLK
jgi:FkbM family methyltransferase